MNKKEIIELLSDYIVSRNPIHDENIAIDGITTNLQNATAQDAAFYKIKNEEKAIENFQARFKNNKPGLLILNHGAEFVKEANCIFIDQEKFLHAQRLILDKLFPNKNKMKIIGVTGTNGKTTTVNLAMQISTMISHPAVSIGTIGVQDCKGEVVSDLESTTPSYVELRKLIFKLQDHYEACFIEVSSHSLVQDRLFDIKLSAGAWTSFSQDHLDYHKTMDEYFKAKLLIEKKLEKNTSGILVPAAEKELYEKILTSEPNAKVKIAPTLDERGVKLADRPLFYHSLYNQSNVELALALNEEIWGEGSVKRIELKNIQTPKGRFSVIELKDQSMAIVDYAHTPDALINIGDAIKKAFPQHSITVVFGCGGNRDKTKRPLMAKAVAAFANKIIVTSDNPRDEAPEDIILDIINGLSVSYEALVDRKKAIETALQEISPKEIILIAGKGHEEYQEIKGIKYPFSDFEIVKKFSHG